MVQRMPVSPINCGLKIRIFLLLQKTHEISQALLLWVSCFMNHITGEARLALLPTTVNDWTDG